MGTKAKSMLTTQNSERSHQNKKQDIDPVIRGNDRGLPHRDRERSCLGEDNGTSGAFAAFSHLPRRRGRRRDGLPRADEAWTSTKAIGAHTPITHTWFRNRVPASIGPNMARGPWRAVTNYPVVQYQRG